MRIKIEKRHFLNLSNKYLYKYIYHNDSDIAEHSVGVVLKGTKKAHLINIRKRSK